MKTSVTLLDLDHSAADAAAPLVGKDPLAIIEAKLAGWQAAGFDPADFAAWSQYFDAHLAQDLNLSIKPAPSAIAASQPKPAAASAIARVVGLASLLLCVFALNSQAQFASSVVTVTNTYNAPVQKAFQVQGFLATLVAQPMTLMLTNVNSNDTYTLSYWSQPHGSTVTNVFPLITITTNFTAAALTAIGQTNGSGLATNGGTVFIPLAQWYGSATNDLWGTFSNSTWSTTSPRTNGIACQ